MPPAARPPAPPQDAPDAASSLCLACGLCCNGVLHGRARLTPDEYPLAEGLGLTILPHGKQPGFRLPCPCWQAGRCSVYAQTRPRICGDYRCKLLRALDAHSVTSTDAQQLVAHAKALIAEIEAMLGAPNAELSIWQRVADFAAAQGHTQASAAFKQAFPALALKLAMLDWLLERHFRHKNADAPTREVLTEHV